MYIFPQGWISKTATEHSPHGFVHSWIVKCEKCSWQLLVSMNIVNDMLTESADFLQGTLNWFWRPCIRRFIGSEKTMWNALAYLTYINVLSSTAI